MGYRVILLIKKMTGSLAGVSMFLQHHVLSPTTLWIRAGKLGKCCLGMPFLGHSI